MATCRYVPGNYGQAEHRRNSDVYVNGTQGPIITGRSRLPEPGRGNPGDRPVPSAGHVSWAGVVRGSRSSSGRGSSLTRGGFTAGARSNREEIAARVGDEAWRGASGGG